MKCLKFSKNQLKKTVSSWIGTTNFVKLATLLKGIYRFNVNPIKIDDILYMYEKSIKKNIENKKNPDMHIQNSITAQAMACRKNNA